MIAGVRPAHSPALGHARKAVKEGWVKRLRGLKSLGKRTPPASDRPAAAGKP
jgi:hypothetical protein